MADALNDANYALPYWDWSTDLANLQSQNKTLKDSNMWTSNALGASISNPVNGVGSPFAGADWKTHDLNGNPNTGYLIRTFISDPDNPLKTPDFLAPLLGTPGYETYGNGEQGFRPILEVEVHNVFHAWIGGQMDFAFSPDDPTFFLHHCFMDKLWAEWQWNMFGRYGFVSSTQPGQIAGQPMRSAANTPWGNVIGANGTIAGISNTNPEDWEIHESRGYRYDDELTWYRLTLITPSHLSEFIASANDSNAIDLVQTPTDSTHLANCVFLLRPGYFSSVKNKSVMLQSTPLSNQSLGTQIDFTNPNQGIYYYSIADYVVVDKYFGFLSAKYFGNKGTLLKRQTFEMSKFDQPIQNFNALVVFIFQADTSTFYFTTDSNNSALEQTSDYDNAEVFNLGVPIAPR
jgi:hypothetical protein